MSLFRPEVTALKAYTMADEPAAIKVNQNEAPWDWPAELKEEAARFMTGVAFNRYPPFDESALTAALAARWGLKPASVLVGNGSNELLQALFLSSLGPGRKVLMPNPTFSLFHQPSPFRRTPGTLPNLPRHPSFDRNTPPSSDIGQTSGSSAG